MKDIAADGLRGVAALNVLLCHLLIAAFPVGFRWMYPSAAAAGALSGKVELVLSAPFMTLAVFGQLAVCIFFVLSGYVLTASYIETGRLDILKVRAARRLIRLGVPVLGAVMLAYGGLSLWPGQAQAAAHITGSAWLAGFWRFSPEFAQALREGVYGVLFDGQSAYNPSLWTMRVELVGSVIVFAYRTLALPGWRQILVGLAWGFALIRWFPSDWPFYFAFVLGSHVGGLPLIKSGRWIACLALVSLVVCGVDASPRYAWLHLSGEGGVGLRLVQVLGAFGLVYAVRCGAGRRVLSWTGVQFLGRISYSMYLVHFPVMLTFYCWLIVQLLERWQFSRYSIVLIAIPSTLVIVALLASLFRAIFDRGGIALSRFCFPER